MTQAAIPATSDHAPSPAPPAYIGRGLIALLAVACGLSVANLYYAQPLLHTIAGDLGVSSGTAGLVVTLSQVGYAIGIALVVPLGDLLDRRKLVPCVLLVTAAALFGCAFAGTIGVLIGLAAVVGLGSVAAQMLVPLGASLAPPEKRGAVVGSIMTGLLTGILVARTLSGLLAGATSWHVVFGSAGVVAVLLAATLAVALPHETARPSLSYGALMRTTLVIVRAQPMLRRRALLGALGFGAFSAFWTTMAFVLAGPHYGYSETAIGLFGLVGAAGALCANVAGRLNDRNISGRTTLVFLLLAAGSFVLLYWGRTSLTAMIVGIVVMDVGIQGLQVTSQGLIYRIAAQAGSRVNSVFMFATFTGGALGSAAGGWTYQRAGWLGVCVLGGAICGAALLVWAFDQLRPAAAAAA